MVHFAHTGLRSSHLTFLRRHVKHPAVDLCGPALFVSPLLLELDEAAVSVDADAAWPAMTELGSRGRSVAAIGRGWMGCKGGRIRFGETVVGTSSDTTERLNPADAMAIRAC